MSAELFIYAVAAVALVLMLYLGLQPEETVRVRDQRAKERAQRRHGGWGLIWFTLICGGIAMVSPTAALWAWVMGWMFYCFALDSRSR